MIAPSKQTKLTKTRVVTKISSCRVNTTSKWGIKWLGISCGSIFLLFSNKSSRGPLSQQPGKIPGLGPGRLALNDNSENTPLPLLILSQKIDALKVKFEEVQRCATKWILSLKPGQMPDGEGLLALDMLPPASNRAVKDLVFFYKVFYGYIDIDITNTQWLFIRDLYIDLYLLFIRDSD